MTPDPITPPIGPPITLIGAGGHALAVHLAARLGDRPIRGVHDDDASAPLLTGADAPRHLGTLGAFRAAPRPGWILAIGDLPARRALLDSLETEPGEPLVHPSAVVSPCAVLGRGVYVGPGAVVHARARVGAHAIINSGAIVEHGCVVGVNAHIAPGAVLCGGVLVGADTLVGAASCVTPGVSIGSGATLGAGSVAVRDIPARAVAIGSPARAHEGAGR